jgi:hypothetical protein
MVQDAEGTSVNMVEVAGWTSTMCHTALAFRYNTILLRSDIAEFINQQITSF